MSATFREELTLRAESVMNVTVLMLLSAFGLLVKVAASKLASENGVAAVLYPLKRFQIILRVLKCSERTLNLALYAESAQYLSNTFTPFQQYCGDSRNRTRPHYLTARYVENRVTWVVTERASRTTSKRSLWFMLKTCCMFWNGTTNSRAIHKDLLFLIVDISKAPGWTAQSKYKFDLYRCFIPSYLLILHWSGNEIAKSVPVWALDSCCQTPRVLPLILIKDYFTNTRENLSAVMAEVHRRSSTFHGKPLRIRANHQYPHSVSEWQENQAKATLRTAHQQKKVALATVLFVLANSRNFTFYTKEPPRGKKYKLDCEEGVLYMNSRPGCMLQPGMLYAQTLILSESKSYRTVYISSPAAPS